MNPHEINPNVIIMLITVAAAILLGIAGCKMVDRFLNKKELESNLQKQ